MNIILPFVTVEPIDGLRIVKKIERHARVAYKSEGKISESSYIPFLTTVINRGHESVLEHSSFTAVFTIDRGISHELVRHRVASPTQESTRYCNYSNDRFGNEISVINPFFFMERDPYALYVPKYELWEDACRGAERAYFALLDKGASPQEARSVLPNSLKTEVALTANIREWRHIFKLRCSSLAHPQMQQVMIPLLIFCKEQIPVVFADVTYNKKFSPNNYAEIFIDYTQK